MDPPKSLYMEVRVLRDLGAVAVGEAGNVNLKQNTLHYFKRTDIEPLIKRGDVIEITTKGCR